MALLSTAAFPHRATIQRRSRAADSLGGSRETRIVEQTNVPCWEQTVNSVEMAEYDKIGVVANRKIYFLEDPGITDRHEIVITRRNGTTVPVANRQIIDGLLPSGPDASVGKGILFKVLGKIQPGQET